MPRINMALYEYRNEPGANPRELLRTEFRAEHPEALADEVVAALGNEQRPALVLSADGYDEEDDYHAVVYGVSAESADAVLRTAADWLGYMGVADDLQLAEIHVRWSQRIGADEAAARLGASA